MEDGRVVGRFARAALARKAAGEAPDHTTVLQPAQLANAAKFCKNSGL
jgi:hypothetical protein